jgi:hypothetical protein
MIEKPERAVATSSGREDRLITIVLQILLEPNCYYRHPK